jgi:hypothetical protein
VQLLFFYICLKKLAVSRLLYLLYTTYILYGVDDMMINGCGAVGGTRIGRGIRSTRRKSAPMPLCPPQIPHDLGSNPGRSSGKPATNRLSYGGSYYSLFDYSGDLSMPLPSHASWCVCAAIANHFLLIYLAASSPESLQSLQVVHFTTDKA